MNIALDFDDVLIVPQLTDIESRKNVKLENEHGVVPIIAANMATIGTLRVAKVLAKYKMVTCLHKFHNLKDFYELESFDHYVLPYIAISAGIDKDSNDNLDNILKEFPQIRFICLDVANGYIKKFIDHVSKIKEKYPDKIIFAGNVATPIGGMALLAAGADYVKIGIGSGSGCLTRVKTGVGYPQLQAILDCHEKFPGRIISDGGCKNPGDICKAFAAGASYVMIGGMLANYDETGNYFYGMSSFVAQKTHYQNAEDKFEYRASEGRHIVFPGVSRGPLENAVKDILGGIRSCLTYCDYNNLSDFIKEADITRFVRVYPHSQYNRIYENLDFGK